MRTDETTLSLSLRKSRPIYLLFLKGKDSLFCTTAIHLPYSFTHMISEVEIYLQKRDTDYGRVECWYLWFFIIFRGDLVLHGGFCCTSIFKTTHLTTLYTDMPYTMHHYALHCTPICPTLYADMPLTIHQYALHYAPLCTTLYTSLVHLLWIITSRHQDLIIQSILQPICFFFIIIYHIIMYIAFP